MPLTRERLEQLIAHSTDIVVATERDGTVSYYNDGASRILGYTAEEVLGEYVALLYPSKAEAKRVMAAMRSPEHGGAGIVETFQTRFRSKAGVEIPVAISGTVLRKEDGSEDGTIGFAKDLRDLLHKEEMATLGEVAIGLSHEINNPLNVILNQAELLERDIERLSGEADSSVETERLDAMRREIGRISEILNKPDEMVRTDKYETIDYVGPAKMIDLRSARAKRERREGSELQGLRILVVDDDGGICRSMTEILEGDGCVVESANDGEEALAKVRAQRFDAVLSDVVMPKMDGYELYQAIRREHPQLPVLMMTAFHYDRDHVIKRSRVEGLEGVIFKKPVDPVRLCEVLAETVSGERRS